MLAETWSEHTMIVLYDLRESFEEARADWERWGREHSDVFLMGLEHVLVAFHPGEAVETAA